jgi:hypothetical protein
MIKSAYFSRNGFNGIIPIMGIDYCPATNSSNGLLNLEDRNRLVTRDFVSSQSLCFGHQEH